MSRFKNALCLSQRPDAVRSWHHQCHRRAGHPGPHRVAYRDGKTAEWSPGARDDKDVVIKPTKRRG